MADAIDTAELARAIAAGERRALARAITLVESERESDVVAAEALLDAVLPRSGNALRLAVTGPPGAGKSTLIDALGRHLLAAGERVAVLAIDPSSHLSGGSLLGDKTRMARLAADPRSFIRPTPSQGLSGGVARRTREALLLCEAAGYSVVIVETVGVGQGEIAAVNLVDCVALVLQPGAGDELQGMKRGLLELSDVIVVNKADGAELERAEQAAAELERALGLFARRPREARVLVASAVSGRNIPELWSLVTAHAAEARESGAFLQRRGRGLRAWLHEEVEALLRARVRQANLAEELAELERSVETSQITPRRAARRWLEVCEAER